MKNPAPSAVEIFAGVPSPSRPSYRSARRFRPSGDEGDVTETAILRLLRGGPVQ